MSRLRAQTALWLSVLSAVLGILAILVASPAGLSDAGPLASTSSTTLVISEVLYDPAGTEPDGEWIEIYNLGCSSVNLRDYKVGDEVIPGGTEGMLRFPSSALIVPGQVIVVANKATAFYAAYGFNPDYEVLESSPAVPNMENYTTWTNGSLALHNDGDDVLLLDAVDSVVDGLSWGTSTYFFSPSAPDVSQGHSLERRPADRDTDVAGDWIDQLSPNPGGAVLDKVFSSADCGPGTLRLHLLNLTPGTTITFDPAVFPLVNPVTISVRSALPSLVQDNVTVDASSAGVVLDGSQLPPGSDGLVIRADGCTIRRLAVRAFSGSGISVTTDVTHTLIASNTLTFNERYGVVVETCDGNTLTGNSIFGNETGGIRSACLPAPQITEITLGATETVTGTTASNARVEFFSDDQAQGQTYEGFTVADVSGVFTFSQPGGFAGPNLTATSTDASGNTSGFAQPTHLSWTLLVYLNGDNDLEGSFFNTLTNTVAAGPSPRANVLVLADGYTTTAVYSGTVLYDLTHGIATPLSTTVTITGERNMGDGQTLVDFVTWARSHYPARHTALAILDHGGGWAPASDSIPEGALPIKRTAWLAGSSGLSWDFTDGHDYLDSIEMRQALATITLNGADPLDVVFYDVCLMGMVEVAYQIEGYAIYFVASPNIGWAPVGPEGRYIHRYVRAIQGIEPGATARQVAELLVETYADAMPQQGHPFTVAAIDLTQLLTVTNAVDDLAAAITRTLTGPEQITTLYQVYSATQKIDYDSDLHIEPDRDGFVDLYDLALRVSQHYTDSDVLAASHAVTTALDAAIVAERHRSGNPWMAWDPQYGLEGVVWELDRVHGLSIFLPLGEDLELPIVVTQTSPITPGLVLSRNLRLRNLYECGQLRFVCDTGWEDLIATYYGLAPSPVPTGTTQGPVDGLLPPDISAPQTVITVNGVIALGEVISVAWASLDAQAGVEVATLWHRPPGGQWTAILTQTGSSGVFALTLLQRCTHDLAVRATDRAGNVEPLENGSNMALVDLQPCGCVYLPLVLRRY